MRDNRAKLQLYLRAKEYAYKIFQRVPGCTLENARRIFTPDLYMIVAHEYSIINEIHNTQRMLNTSFAKTALSYDKMSKIISELKMNISSTIQLSMDYIEKFESFNFDGQFDKFSPIVARYRISLKNIEKEFDENFKKIDFAMRKIPLLSTYKDMQQGLLAVQKEAQYLINGGRNIIVAMMKLNEEMLEEL